MELKNCIIKKYDPETKEPPFNFIQVDTVQVHQPKKDYLGQDFFNILSSACREKGYRFKFYTMSDEKDFDYEIVIK